MLVYLTHTQSLLDLILEIARFLVYCSAVMCAASEFNIGKRPTD